MRNELIHQFTLYTIYLHSYPAVDTQSKTTKQIQTNQSMGKNNFKKKLLQKLQTHTHSLQNVVRPQRRIDQHEHTSLIYVCN